MSHKIEKPIFVYTRIEENRRYVSSLVFLFVVLLAPAVIFLSSQLLVFILSLMMDIDALEPYYSGTRFLILIFIVGACFTSLVVFVEFHTAGRAALRGIGARPLEHGEEREFQRIVENLCIGSGLPRPVLYLAEVATPNAFSIGLSTEHSKLVITRGLLELLEWREIEGVIAHELSHIANRDTRLYTITSAMESLLSFPWRILRAISELFGSLSEWLGKIVYALGILNLTILVISLLISLNDPYSSGWSINILILIAYLILVGPLFGLVVRMAVARQREFLADADAYLLTRNPEALARALVKIDSVKVDKMKVDVAMARMYFVDPRHTQQYTILSAVEPYVDTLPQNHFGKLFYVKWCDVIMTFLKSIRKIILIRLNTHPTIYERVTALKNMGGHFSPQKLHDAKEVGEGFIYTPYVSSSHPEGKKHYFVAAFHGILSGTITTVVLSFLMLLIVMSPQIASIHIHVHLIPGVISAGVAAYRAGVIGSKAIAYGIILGLISWISIGFYTPLGIDDEKDSPFLYILDQYIRSLLEVLLGAILGALSGWIRFK